MLCCFFFRLEEVELFYQVVDYLFLVFQEGVEIVVVVVDVDLVVMGMYFFLFGCVVYFGQGFLIYGKFVSWQIWSCKEIMLVDECCVDVLFFYGWGVVIGVNVFIGGYVNDFDFIGIGQIDSFGEVG